MQLTTCVVTCDGVKTLAELLSNSKFEEEYELLCVTVWALGQIGRHCPQAVAEGENILSRILYFLNKLSIETVDSEVMPKDTFQSGKISETLLKPYGIDQDAAIELRARCKTTLRQSIQGCTTLGALEPLLHANTPPDLLKNVLAQFTKVSKFYFSKCFLGSNGFITAL